MEDGIENIRYILMNMMHPNYDVAIEEFTKLHTDKQAGNKLTVLPNIANTRSVVKVVAHVGWIEENRTRLQNAINSGLIIRQRDYTALPEVLALLASPDWPQPTYEE